MSKAIILKSKCRLSKNDKEEFVREIEEKTGIKTVIIGPEFEIQVIEGDE